MCPRFLSIKVHSSELRIKVAVKLFQRKTITVNAIRLLYNNIHHRTMQDKTQTHYGNCPDLLKYTRCAVVCKCTSLLTLRTKTAIVTYRPQAVLQAAKAMLQLIIIKFAANGWPLIGQNLFSAKHSR